MPYTPGLTKEQRYAESNLIWQNIRKSGRITCHGVAIPKVCEQDICNDYPLVNLCSYCNTCPCIKKKLNQI